MWYAAGAVRRAGGHAATSKPAGNCAVVELRHAYGANSVGLERRGFSKERIRKIHHAYKLLLASKLNTSQALERMKSEADRGEDVDMAEPALQ